MTQKYISGEITRLKTKYKDIPLFQKNELFETIPHPTPLSFDILNRIYSPKGSLGMAYIQLGYYFHKKSWMRLNFVETIFGSVAVNRTLEQIIFHPFFKKPHNYLLLPYYIYKELKKNLQYKN